MKNINQAISGSLYANVIINYLKNNYSNRGINIYREISLGKTIIGKNRRIDIFIVHEGSSKVFAIECKFQEVVGTVDEKIPYALEDIEKSPVNGGIVYAGNGFSEGILHMLEASPFAAYCLPNEKMERTNKTREFDHMLAINFSWWDILIKNKKPV